MEIISDRVLVDSQQDRVAMAYPLTGYNFHR